MNRQEMYKTRPAFKNDRIKEHKTRGKHKRSDAYFNNRQMDITDEHLQSPQPGTSSQGTLVMKSINKALDAKKFHNKTEQRIFKLREIRKRVGTQKVDERSPFVATVPVGRIVPRKRDIIEKKMKEFHERQEKIARSTTKRRSINTKGKRKSVGKITNGLSVKKSNNKVAPLKTRRSLNKKQQAVPQPGPSNTNMTLKVKPNTFAKPTIVVPVTRPKRGKAKQEEETFNVLNSFITSTAQKPNNAHIIPSDEPQPVAFTSQDDTFFDGISPLNDASPFKFVSSSASPTAALLKNKKSVNLPKQNAVTTETNNLISDDESTELNRTFTQSDDEKPDIKSDDSMKMVHLVLQDDLPEQSTLTRRVSVPKSLKLPVIQVNDMKIDSIDENNQKDNKINEKKQTSLRKSKSITPEGKIEIQNKTFSNEKPRRSSRMNNETPIDLEKQEQEKVANMHYNTLNMQIQRLKDRNLEWKQLKADNEELDEHAIGMIDTAVGQSELLMNKKFTKFKQLIDNYVKNEGEQAIFPDDLDGYWQIVVLEIENIDSRFNELEKLKANNWKEPELQEVPKAKAKRGGRKAKISKPETGAMSNLQLFLKELKKNKLKTQENEKENEEKSEVTGTPNRSKRFGDTPRKSVSKRRSLNCSGCTPSSHRKTKSIVHAANVTESGGKKSTRKSVKKINFAEMNMEVTEQPALESVAHRSILKSSNKRSTKSVIFDVDTPEKSVREKKTIKKTPRRTTNNSTLDVLNENSENSPASTYNTPIDSSFVNTSRGNRRNTRKSTPKANISLALSEIDDSPLSALEHKRPRRSTRLFS